MKLQRRLFSVFVKFRSNLFHRPYNHGSYLKISTVSNLGTFKEKLTSGPSLKQFLNVEIKVPDNEQAESEDIPYVSDHIFQNMGRKVFLETYGCQMNVSDSEIVSSILIKNGFQLTKNILEADVIFVVTCAIREGAEQKIWNRLQVLKSMKQKRKNCQFPLKIGVLGCMAERLKNKLIEKEKMVDIVAGPDSYRDLPNLLNLANEGQKAVNVILSADETYADILPVRTNSNAKTAFVSIMRGCDNMCTFCIVPFTRGRERSRPLTSIVDEVKYLSDQGYKEVTLLGQNVNSYRDISGQVPIHGDILSKGFTTVYPNRAGGLRFADLLEKVADVNPEMRIRFTSPHPKDFPDSLLEVMKEKPNICRLIHLPAQSGNSAVLKTMRRGYTREAYLDLIHHIRNIIPGVAFTSDFICGFCGESEAAHLDTLSLMKIVKYEFVYVFPYSLRNKTAAYHKLKDDVPEDVKKRRAEEAHAVFREETLELHRKEIGKEHLILVSGVSKRSERDWYGRNDWNTKVIFPYTEIPHCPGSDQVRKPCIGDYIVVKINDCSSQVLKGEAVCHTTLQEFSRRSNKNLYASCIL